MHLQLMAAKCRASIVTPAMLLAVFLLQVGNVSEADETSRHSGSRTLVASELFDESILAENVLRVRQRAFELPDDQRYQSLIDWVLPSSTHDTIRMSGAFTPTDPASVVPQQYLDASGSGGTLVSPTFDMLDLAAKLGCLQDVHDRLQSLPEPSSESQQPAITAFRVLVAPEQNEESAVDSDIMELRRLGYPRNPAGR